MCVQSRKVKDRVIKLATELFMRYGLKSVSMDDISREAGISKKTLYQNIDNKQDLINQCLYNIILEDHKNIESIVNIKEYDALQQMIEIFKLAIKLLSSVKPTVIYDLQKYYKESWKIVENMHLKHMELIIVSNLLQGKNERVYRKTIDEEIVSRLFIQKMIAVTNDNIMRETNKPLPEILYQNLLYHLHGIIDKSQYERLEDLTVNFKMNQNI